MSLEPFRMKLIEVVAAEFFIRATVALKVIADDQQAMSYSDERSFATSSCGQSFELSRQVTVFRSHCCPRGLTGYAAQPWTALAAFCRSVVCLRSHGYLDIGLPSLPDVRH